MNAEISETIGARLLGFGMQIPKLLTQRKFVSATFIRPNCKIYNVGIRHADSEPGLGMQIRSPPVSASLFQ